MNAREPAEPKGTVITLPSASPPQPITFTIRLEPIRLIGRGACGAVFEARDLDLRRSVAVKVALPEYRAALLAETRALSQCVHPNLLPVLGLGELDGEPGFAMPYIAGGSLATAADHAGRVDPVVLVRLLEPIGAALDALHAHGLVHRDIKPANILIGDGPGASAYLTDLGSGLAAVRTTPEDAVSVGTLGFAAPEQLAAEPCDARTDVYGLGATIWWCLTGEYATPSAAAQADLRSHRPDLDPHLDEVLGRALAANPDDRYPSAGAAVAAVNEWLGRAPRPTQRGPDLRSASTITPTRARSRSRSRWGGGGGRRRHGAMVALAALGVLVVAALGWWLLAASPRATSTAGSPEASTTTISGRAADPTLDAATQALQSAIPEPLRTTCTLAPVTSGVAALQCRDEATATTVTYFSFPDTSTLSTWFDRSAVAATGTTTSPPPTASDAAPSTTTASTGATGCAAGQAAQVSWRARRADAAPTGRLRCAPITEGSEIVWTTDDLRIGAVATTTLPLRDLWAWWQRVPGPVTP